MVKGIRQHTGFVDIVAVCPECGNLLGIYVGIKMKNVEKYQRGAINISEEEVKTLLVKLCLYCEKEKKKISKYGRGY